MEMDPLPPLIDLNDDDDAPRFFDRYSSSPSSTTSSSSSTSSPTSLNGVVPSSTTTKRLDYMLQFLDRKLSTETATTTSLPEFIAKGVASAIFNPPSRSVLHPDRPPSLDLRPHPLRETQINRFLRTIASTDSHLLCGSENGTVRVWDFKDLYEAGNEDEEEDTAPFLDSSSSSSASPTLCLVADLGTGVVWSGHKDGKIRCWKMANTNTKSPFKEALSWQTNRGPVLSMIVTCYGNVPLPVNCLIIEFVL